jgi:hypothetical protein
LNIPRLLDADILNSDDTLNLTYLSYFREVNGNLHSKTNKRLFEMSRQSKIYDYTKDDFKKRLPQICIEKNLEPGEAYLFIHKHSQPKKKRKQQRKRESWEYKSKESLEKMQGELISFADDYFLPSDDDQEFNLPFNLPLDDYQEFNLPL